MIAPLAGCSSFRRRKRREARENYKDKCKTGGIGAFAPGGASGYNAIVSI